jgi:hypothetical protein
MNHRPMRAGARNKQLFGGGRVLSERHRGQLYLVFW